ncbi:hypothetical protein [Facklamia sp. P12932]|uniref:hypothetical protein n=1 Tax=Facklamia sp. P12932 TaxID=3421947 RepID=UPI003D177AAA
MIYSTIVLGWLGILLFLLILLSFKKMAKNNEYALLHLMQAIMYTMWLPLPFAFYQLLDSDILLVGSVFGSVYLILLVVGVALQTGHLAFISKYNEDKKISDSQTNYMMATLSHPYEGLVNVFKCIWALFLGIFFFQNGETVMAGWMFLFGLFIIYYLIIILEASLIIRLSFFEKVKPNTIFVNIEPFLFFLTLMIYITFNF